MNPALREQRAAFNHAIRTRITLIAAERGLPKSEIKKAMGLKYESLKCFAQRHRVDIRWLLFGDLKGLLKTVRAAKAA